VRVLQSNAENLMETLEDSSGLVIATPGAVPRTAEGFALVVILEADRFFMQSDIRAHERCRELFFSTVAMASPRGHAALVTSLDNPLLGALASWKPALVSQRELRERHEVHLPPYSRAITMDIAELESQTLIRGLKKAQEDGRLPVSTRFLGPSPLKDGVHRIVLLSPLADGEALISLIHEFQRRRSSSKKTLATIRIDPYSLSR
jgi:primosomal protein N' (replication factor Y)